MRHYGSPRWYESRFPNLACFLNNLAPRESRGRVGLHYRKLPDGRPELPVYSQVRRRLPQPVVEDKPEWVELYHWIWEAAYTRHLNSPVPETGFVADYIDAGLDKKLYQWDMFFIVMYARYGHHIFPAVQALDNFYAKQRENGMIHRIFSEKTGKEHWWGNYPNSVNPPLFAWTELQNLKLTGDLERIRRIMPALEAHAAWIFENKKNPDSKHGLYWSTGDASGMDNTPRRGTGWIDMSCQVALNHTSISKLYERLDDKVRADLHRNQAVKIGERINRWMWDDADGFYYDVDHSGRRNKVKTIASFWPLIAEVASSDQVKSLVGHLTDPDEFWTDVPFPSLAKNQKRYCPSGRYWHGGVWAPTNYMILKGLSAHGYDQLALEAAERYLEVVFQVFRTTGTVWELYAPERNSDGAYGVGIRKDGRRPCKDDFVGWSGIGPVSVLIETILGLDVDGERNHIRWTINRCDRHGIRNLRVGTACVDQICRRREHPDDPISIDAETDGPVSMTINRIGTEKDSVVALEAGRRTLELI
ncbi:MAG: hypothetical protein GY866_06385 [Proteobacteria bacterium]|nr:hypothetical protein [Pseudomonadota bacterium]